MVEHSKASHIENTDINNDDDDMSQFSEDLPMGSLTDRLRLQVFGAAHSMYGYQDIVLIMYVLMLCNVTFYFDILVVKVSNSAVYA